jgi:hypothetical protein
MPKTAQRIVALVVHEDEEDVAGFLGGVGEGAEKKE